MNNPSGCNDQPFAGSTPVSDLILAPARQCLKPKKFGPNTVTEMASCLVICRSRIFLPSTGCHILRSRMRPKSVGTTKFIPLRGVDSCERCLIVWRSRLLTCLYRKDSGLIPGLIAPSVNVNMARTSRFFQLVNSAPLKGSINFGTAC